MKAIHSRRSQQGREPLGVIDLSTATLPFEARNPHGDREVVTDLLANAGENFERKLCAAFELAAGVFVRTKVSKRRNKGTQHHVVMCRVELDAVVAGFARTPCPLAVHLDDRLDLFKVHLATDLLRGFGSAHRRAHRLHLLEERRQ